LRFLTDVPQTWSHPYIVYGTVMRLLRVPIAIIHLAGWVLALRHHPVIALGFLIFYVHSMLPTHRAFWAAYPYMFTFGNLLAAIAVDFSPVPIGLWGILTINTDHWVHGDGTTAQKQPFIAKKATERPEALARTTSDVADWLFSGASPSTVPSGQPCPSSGNPTEPAHTGGQTKDMEHQDEALSKKEE
jgi:hypothetical protein